MRVYNVFYVLYVFFMSYPDATAQTLRSGQVWTSVVKKNYPLKSFLRLFYRFAFYQVLLANDIIHDFYRLVKVDILSKVLQPLVEPFLLIFIFCPFIFFTCQRRYIQIITELGQCIYLGKSGAEHFLILAIFIKLE